MNKRIDCLPTSCYNYRNNFILFIHLDIWTFGLFLVFWLLWMLLWIFVYEFLCRHMFSFLLGIYLGVELLGHVVILLIYLTLWRTTELFFKVDAPLYIPTISPHFCKYSLLSDFLILAMLVGVKCYLIVILICICLVANHVEHLFICLVAICISSLEKCLFRCFAQF